MTNFDRAVALVLNREGVFSNIAGDPGGATVYGIARADHPNISWPPTIDDAISIYRAQYWDANSCDDLPWPVCLAVFDADVNQGNRIGALCLQQALGVTQDGNIGPVTLGAVASRDPIDLAARVLAIRAVKYAATANFDKFGQGWMYRILYESLEQAA